jgi:hypothetical protein
LWEGNLGLVLPKQAVEALTKPYASTQEALSKIATSMNDYYQTNYAAVYVSKEDSIRGAVAEVQRLFQTYLFSENEDRLAKPYG